MSKKSTKSSSFLRPFSLLIKIAFVFLIAFHGLTCRSISCDAPVGVAGSNHHPSADAMIGEVAFCWEFLGVHIYQLLKPNGDRVWVKVSLNKKVPAKGERVSLCVEKKQLWNLNGWTPIVFIELERSPFPPNKSLTQFRPPDKEGRAMPLL